MEDKTYEEWINQIANQNGNTIYLADNTEVIDEIGYWIEFIYPSGRKWEFIFYNEILN